jgi:methionyl-tRNA synthetase
MATLEDFQKLNLRVGTIKSVADHPRADRLYVLRVDLDGEERQLVAGIKRDYSPGELRGKQIVVVENLAPAIIRGVESNGMLLAAQDGDRIAIVVPEKPVKTGSVVK